MNSTIFSNISWVATLLGAIAYFALGALWYSFLFQKKWIEYTRVSMTDPNAKKGVGAIMFGSFIMMFICSWALAILASILHLSGWMVGIKLGLLTGVCFAFTSMAINMLYEKKPVGLYFINGGYQLLGNIIAAVIICSWR
ncbi:MAG: DUF1761 domain-containing protein [Ginsengibacter sp.]